MVIVFGEDSNFVDDECYRLRHLTEPVKGVCTIYGLRTLLKEVRNQPLCIRLIPNAREANQDDIVLTLLDPKAVDAVMGS